MASVKTIRRYFITTRTYPSRRRPWIETGWTQEIEWPYRFGTGIVVRLPYTLTGIMIGQWQERKREEQALLTAVQGFWLEDEDVGS